MHRDPGGRPLPPHPEATVQRNAGLPFRNAMQLGLTVKDEKSIT